MDNKSNMVAFNNQLWSVWPTLILLLTSAWEADGDIRPPAEEVEIFNSDTQSVLGWTSEPRREWSEIVWRDGAERRVLMLQACGRRITRTILSRWMERKEAHNLLMDVSFTQEEETSAQLSPLQVHLFDSDQAITTFHNSWTVLDLRTPDPFPGTFSPNQIWNHFNRSVALSLGSVSSRGFQLGFSYSATCVLVSSIRLYYRRCPEVVSDLVRFPRTAAGSEPSVGSCLQGAVVVSRPSRRCDADGVWGPLRGGCTCKPGHQLMNHTCEACRTGYYNPEENGGCRPCPPNSRTHGSGSESCDCLQGFRRLPHDPADLGCTRPPSAPINVTSRYHNDSVLIVTWDPPLDSGGRQELMYRVKCEKEVKAGGRWDACGDDLVFTPDSAGLVSTSVSITGLDPQSDYRLSVQAWNDIPTLPGGPPPSTTTVVIHPWRVPSSSSSPWFTVGGVPAGVLLMALISFVVCVVCRNKRKLRFDQEVELLPMNTGISYQRQPESPAAPRQGHREEEEEGVVQLLEGISGRLLASLKDVLVERNKLVLGKEFGKGEFGSVHEGVLLSEEGEDIKVAVKTRRVGIHCEEDLHEFLREAEIMKNFDHVNVVRLLGVTLQREQDSPLPVPLVILPYMKHRDLRRFLIATRYGDIPMFVPHQSLLRFMIDISAGMDYLSSQGFLHRDLAARNCMLGDDRRVCVADFGLSKDISSRNYYRQKVVACVPAKWMAMESLSESVYTTKTDVWSFGVTMWEILSKGRTPYPGISNHELLDVLLSGHRLKPPEDCDQKLYEVMQSCWDKEPTRRPGFRELGEKLKGFLSELPVLEASQEANYINQGLDVASYAAASQDPHNNSGGRSQNEYLATPVGAAAAREEDMDKSGYCRPRM